MNDKKTGKVVFFKRGYGFIKPDDDSNDIFIHYSDIVMEGFKVLHKDDTVEYEIGSNIKGLPKAINVLKI